MNLLEELLESAVFQQISKKLKTPESFGIQGFQWSCWADSNRRPHPYQLFFDCFPLLQLVVPLRLETIGIKGVSKNPCCNFSPLVVS